MLQNLISRCMFKKMNNAKIKNTSFDFQTYFEANRPDKKLIF